MICLLFYSYILSSQEVSEIIYLRERVEMKLFDNLLESYDREIYYDRNLVRIDELDKKKSYIFLPKRNMMVVLDHENSSFSYVSPFKADDSLVKTMLKGLGYLVGDQLQRRKNTIVPTGLKRKISEWQSQEFKLNYPSSTGITTKIWCASEPTIFSKSNYKNYWYALIGGNPSGDANRVVSQFFKDIPGIPIKFETKINQQNSEITITSTLTVMELRQIKNMTLFDIPKNYSVQMIR